MRAWFIVWALMIAAGASFASAQTARPQADAQVGASDIFKALTEADGEREFAALKALEAQLGDAPDAARLEAARAQLLAIVKQEVARHGDLPPALVMSQIANRIEAALGGLEAARAADQASLAGRLRPFAVPALMLLAGALAAGLGATLLSLWARSRSQEDTEELREILVKIRRRLEALSHAPQEQANTGATQAAEDAAARLQDIVRSLDARLMASLNGPPAFVSVAPPAPAKEDPAPAVAEALAKCLETAAGEIGRLQQAAARLEQLAAHRPASPDAEQVAEATRRESQIRALKDETAASVELLSELAHVANGQCARLDSLIAAAHEAVRCLAEQTILAAARDEAQHDRADDVPSSVEVLSELAQAANGQCARLDSLIAAAHEAVRNLAEQSVLAAARDEAQLNPAEDAPASVEILSELAQAANGQCARLDSLIAAAHEAVRNLAEQSVLAAARDEAQLNPAEDAPPSVQILSELAQAANGQCARLDSLIAAAHEAVRNLAEQSARAAARDEAQLHPAEDAPASVQILSELAQAANGQCVRLDSLIAAAHEAVRNLAEQSARAAALDELQPDPADDAPLSEVARALRDAAVEAAQESARTADELRASLGLVMTRIEAASATLSETAARLGQASQAALDGTIDMRNETRRFTHQASAAQTAFLGAARSTEEALRQAGESLARHVNDASNLARARVQTGHEIELLRQPIEIALMAAQGLQQSALDQEQAISSANEAALEIAARLSHRDSTEGSLVTPDLLDRDAGD